MNHDRSYGLAAGRLLLALIFVVSGFQKLIGPAATASYIASKGLPFPLAGAILAGALETVLGLMIGFGVETRKASALLFVYLIPVTAIFHAGLSGAGAQMEMIQVLKNLAIMGGLMSVAAAGPGRISIDEWESRRHRPSAMEQALHTSR